MQVDTTGGQVPEDATSVLIISDDSSPGLPKMPCTMYGGITKANFQLREGVLPDVKKGDYNPRTFARLLLARAKLLRKDASDDESGKLLASCFIEMAAYIDPRNEDAVFEFESQRIDHGEINWALLTDSARDAPGLNADPGAPLSDGR